MLQAKFGNDWTKYVREEVKKKFYCQVWEITNSSHQKHSARSDRCNCISVLSLNTGRQTNLVSSFHWASRCRPRRQRSSGKNVLYSLSKGKGAGSEGLECRWLGSGESLAGQQAVRAITLLFLVGKKGVLVICEWEVFSDTVCRHTWIGANQYQYRRGACSVEGWSTALFSSPSVEDELQWAPAVGPTLWPCVCHWSETLMVQSGRSWAVLSFQHYQHSIARSKHLFV